MSESLFSKSISGGCGIPIMVRRVLCQLSTQLLVTECQKEHVDGGYIGRVGMWVVKGRFWFVVQRMWVQSRGEDGQIAVMFGV